MSKQDKMIGHRCNKVVQSWIALGMHRGEHGGAAPKGKHDSVSEISILRITNKKIMEDNK